MTVDWISAHIVAEGWHSTPISQANLAEYPPVIEVQVYTITGFRAAAGYNGANLALVARLVECLLNIRRLSIITAGQPCRAALLFLSLARYTRTLCAKTWPLCQF